MSLVTAVTRYFHRLCASFEPPAMAMSHVSVVVALFMACLGVASGSSAVLVAPPALKQNPVAELRRSTTQLWTNFQACQLVRKEKKAGAVVDYNMHYTLKRGAMDRTKLFQLVWVASAAKWSTPLIAYFFPSMLPSTFETASACKTRLDQSSTLRRSALLELLAKVDAGKCAQNTVIEALGSSAKAKALAQLTARQTATPLKDLPIEAVHAASKALSGPFKLAPRWLHMQTIRGALKAVEEGDLALRASKLDAIPRATLAEACNERAIQIVHTESDKQLRGALAEWLALTAPADKAGEQQAHAVRLALIAINTVGSTRSTLPTQAAATNALYARGAY